LAYKFLSLFRNTLLFLLYYTESPAYKSHMDLDVIFIFNFRLEMDTHLVAKFAKMGKSFDLYWTEPNILK